MEEESAIIIPLEMQEVILAHLDLKHLLKFRFVSKSWNELICSKYLKDIHPPIEFSKTTEGKGRGATQFDELMENSIQSFPFSKFRVDLTENGYGSGPRSQSWQSDILLFAGKYGCHIKHYEIWIDESIKGEELVTKTKTIEFLLNHAPNLESVQFSSILPLITSLNLTTPLRKLKDIGGIFTIPLTAAQGCIIDSLLAVGSNLQEINISYWRMFFPKPRDADLDMSLTLSKLRQIRNFPVISLSMLEVSPTAESMELLRGLMELPLRVQNLEVTVLYERNERLQEMLDVTTRFISSFSSTLKTLEMYECFSYEDSLPKFQLPPLENLEKISVENLDWLTQLDFLQFPNLVGISLEHVKQANLEYILTKFTQLKHLSLGFKFGVDEFILRILIGGETIPSVRDSWMTAPLEGVEAPPNDPAVPSLANMTNLVTLSLNAELEDRVELDFDTVRGSLRELIGITYLSSIKKIRRLDRLELESFVANEEDALVKRLLSRLRECHKVVETKYFDKPLSDYADSFSGSCSGSEEHCSDDSD